MKLFLSSVAISDSQAPHFLKLVNKAAKDTRFVLIENAVDVETGNTAWLYRNRDMFNKLGMQLSTLDLREYKTKNISLLRKALELADVIWLGGGNTFYLRWLMQETGADLIIKELVEKQTIYGGASAGAIVAGPTLKYFEAADDPKASPQLIERGLGLTDFVVVPHVGNRTHCISPTRRKQISKQQKSTTAWNIPRFRSYR